MSLFRTGCTRSPTEIPNVRCTPSKIGNAPFLVDWAPSKIGNATFLVDWAPSKIGNAPFLVDWASSKIGNASFLVDWASSKIGNTRHSCAGRLVVTFQSPSQNGRHSEFSERHLSTDGGHSEFYEWHFASEKSQERNPLLA